MTKPLIFTPEITGNTQSFKLASPLMRRLANLPGPEGNAVRAQIERAARIVPEAQHDRVFGQLRSLSASEDQARSSIGLLLFAKTMSDLGWTVEHEPEFSGDTPDLRISRNDRTYIVEVVRVTRSRPANEEAAILRVRDALAACLTNTPIQLNTVHVSGGASLKPFVRHIQKVLSCPPPKGIQAFHNGDVHITYEVHPPLSSGIKVPAIAFLPGRVLHGGGQELIRDKLNEKLSRYKFPIVVALDFFDLSLSFSAVKDVLLGDRVITYDFSPTDGLIGEGRPGRSDSGLLMDPGHNGVRARSRLVGALPFRLCGSAPDGSWEVAVQLIANPAYEPLHDFAEFAPIPRFVAQRDSEGRTFLEHRAETEAAGPGGRRQDWRHHP